MQGGSKRPGSGPETLLGVHDPDAPLDAPLSPFEQVHLRDILLRASEPDGLAPPHQRALDDYVIAICRPTLERSAGLRAARRLLRTFALSSESLDDPGHVPEPMVVPVPEAVEQLTLTPTPALAVGREPILALLLDLPPSEKTEPLSPLAPR